MLNYADMKRVTIALDEEMYLALLEYAGERSKREMRRFSMGEAIRHLVSSQLAAIGYTGGRTDVERTSSLHSTISTN